MRMNACILYDATICHPYRQTYALHMVTECLCIEILHLTVYGRGKTLDSPYIHVVSRYDNYVCTYLYSTYGN